MVRILLYISLSLTSVSLFAQGSMPNIKVWVKNEIANIKPEKLFQKVLLLDDYSGSYKAWMPSGKNKAQIINSDFISFINPKDIEMCDRVNYNLARKESSFKLPRSGNQALLWHLKCSMADTIIVGGPKTKRWTFYKLDKDGKLVKIYKASAPKKLELSALKSWFKSKLGYDGIVLAKKGNFLLAGLVNKAKSKKAQALLLKSSNDKFYIRGKKGAALLQLVSTTDGFALFEIIINNDNVKDLEYAKVVFNVK